MPSGQAAKRAKVAIYAVGSILAVACLLFLAARVAKLWPSIAAVRIVEPKWLLFAIAAYGVSHLTTALSWPLALRQLGQKIPLDAGIRIGLVAQAGKYLPGNVAHYFGRAALARNLGVKVSASGISTLIELGSLAFACLIVSSAAFVAAAGRIARLPVIPNSAMIVAGVVIACAIAGTVFLLRKGVRPAIIAGPTLCLATSFTLAGLSFHALGMAIGHAPATSLALFAYVLAWGIGFAAPGAPAGFGIREAVLLFLLSSVIGESATLGLALYHRLLTMLVDGGAALVGYGWTALNAVRKNKSPQTTYCQDPPNLPDRDS